MDTEEYIIINKTAIQKRIEELEKNEDDEFFDEQRINHLLGQINALQYALSQSTPLIPEIEKAFDEGAGYLDITLPVECKKEYISNLKIK